MKNKIKERKAFECRLEMVENTAELTISGFIGWDTEAEPFCDLVKQAVDAGAGKLVVKINSMGGSCYDGLAMGDALRQCGVPTRAEVLGYAMSMGSYLVQCCDERVAYEHATLMFHQPSAGLSGTVDELAVEAAYLCKMRDRMFADIGARCGKTGEEINEMFRVAQYYSAEEARELGFIDAVIGGEDDDDDKQSVVVPEPGAEGMKLPRVMDYSETQLAFAMLADATAWDAVVKNEPVAEPVAVEPVAEPAAEPVAEPAAEPAAAVEPDNGAGAKNATNITGEPAATGEPVVEPQNEPAAVEPAEPVAVEPVSVDPVPAGSASVTMSGSELAMLVVTVVREALMAAREGLAAAAVSAPVAAVEPEKVAGAKNETKVTAAASLPVDGVPVEWLGSVAAAPVAAHADESQYMSPADRALFEMQR